MQDAMAARQVVRELELGVVLELRRVATRVGRQVPAVGMARVDRRLVRIHSVQRVLVQAAASKPEPKVSKEVS